MKINDQFFLQIQETLFLAHFLNFWGKKRFSKKLGCHAQLLKGFSHHAKKIQRNLMIQSKKTPTDDRKDGQTLFQRILPATPGDLTSTTAVDWHLKVRDIE